MNKYILLLGFCCFSASASATNVVIKYNDIEQDNKTGFFDRNSRISTASNPGETVGEARRYAFEYAAKIIESQVYSEADIIISANYAPAGSFTASTQTNLYTHTETYNYDDFGILKDGVKYNPLIRRMLQNDTRDQQKHYSDGYMQFNYKGANYEIANAESENAGFVNLVLHEMVHALGFNNSNCYTLTCESDSPSQSSMNIYVDAPYDSPWDEMTLTDKQTAVIEGDKVFYNGGAALQEYISLNLGTGYGEHGIMLHSEPTSSGDISSQSLGHISANVDSVELMKSRVGNTLSIGAAAYYLCDIGWCRNTGFVTDFKLENNFPDKILPSEPTNLGYTVSNPNDHALENVFLTVNVYDANLVNADKLSSNCSMTETVISCDIGNLEAFGEYAVDIPFVAEDGKYKVLSNVYSNSYLVDIDGSNNVHATVITVGELPFPDVTIVSEFTFEEESQVSIKPTFEASSALSFNWQVTSYDGTSFELSENSETGEATFTAPSIDEDKTLTLKLIATFDDRTEEFEVTVYITAKSDSTDTNTGTDTGSGANNNSGTENGSTSNNNNQTISPDSNDESSGGSFNLFFLLIIFSALVNKHVRISKS
ncbi:hypothetical protein ACOYR1_06010 [Thalassotalea piscium]